MIKIVSFSDPYAAAFKSLNLEWLDKYNLTESHDFVLLDNPVKAVIKKGGFVYLALQGDEVVGTAALINEGHGTFELAKMSVAPAFQGKGIGNLLIEHCLEKAKIVEAKKIFLFSNRQLSKAISLYEKYGFKHIAVTDAPFETADVKMELIL